MKNGNLNLPKVRAILAVIIYLGISMPLLSQAEQKLVIGQQPVYKVSRAKEPIVVDGRMDEATWKNAEVVSFDYFYRADKQFEKQLTKFRMLWNDTCLYLFYECQDTSLTARETKPDGRPYLDDCAEFFCLPIPDSLNFHFGFEININKAAYDYVMLWRYYNNRHFFIPGYNPVYKYEVIYDGTINNDKDRDKMWQMEIAIPFSAFSNFTGRPRAGARWAFQAVRQDRNYVNDRFRSTSTLYPIYDIKLDVHQPSRFGILEFSEN